jgi:hypothetical protein
MHGLIDGFRLGDCRAMWLVVTLVDQRRAVIGKAILVGRLWTDRHEDEGMLPAQAEVHATSQACALAATHVGV